MTADPLPTLADQVSELAAEWLEADLAEREARERKMMLTDVMRPLLQPGQEIVSEGGVIRLTSAPRRFNADLAREVLSPQVLSLIMDTAPSGKMARDLVDKGILPSALLEGCYTQGDPYVRRVAG